MVIKKRVVVDGVNSNETVRDCVLICDGVYWLGYKNKKHLVKIMKGGKRKMQYKTISNIKKPVSPIFFGTAIEGFYAGSDQSELLDAIYEKGINAFDCARGYMMAEKSLGDWVDKRGLRDKVVLLSKCGHPSIFGRSRLNEKDIRTDFERSARNLKTDFIDIYMLHRDDTNVEVGTIVEILNAMHAEGKIGVFGGSNWTFERIAEANEYAYSHNLIPFTVSSPNFGLADQVRDPWGGGCVTISGPANRKEREWYAENQMPVIAYSSLGRGLFSGRLKSSELDKAAEVLDDVAMKGYACPENYERLRRCEELAKEKNCTVPQIAMAWIFGQKINTFAVVSTKNPSRMQENIEALDLHLTEEELLYMDLQK